MKCTSFSWSIPRLSPSHNDPPIVLRLRLGRGLVGTARARRLGSGPEV